MGRYKIRIDKLYNEFPFDVYVMDKKTGRSGVVNSFKTLQEARISKRTLWSELRRR